jgi:hypothetical protein
MISVPVCRHDQHDLRGRIGAKLLEVPERYGLSSCRVDAGINTYPLAVADMNDNALSAARAKDRELELITLRWGRSVRRPRIFVRARELARQSLQSPSLSSEGVAGIE